MMDSSCQCDKCVSLCKGTPGWFMPGEAEKVAESMGLPFEEFAEKYLIKDHASNPLVDDAPYIWSPKRVGIGEEGSSLKTFDMQRQKAPCIFLKDDRCSIHSIKPWECGATFGCSRPHQPNKRSFIEEKWIEAGAPLGYDR